MDQQINEHDHNKKCGGKYFFINKGPSPKTVKEIFEGKVSFIITKWWMWWTQSTNLIYVIWWTKLIKGLSSPLIVNKLISAVDTMFKNMVIFVVFLVVNPPMRFNVSAQAWFLDSQLIPFFIYRREEKTSLLIQSQQKRLHPHMFEGR